MKRIFLLAATTLCLAGCTWTVDMRGGDEEDGTDAPEPFFVEARLFYPERVALPGDAEVLVAVDAVGSKGRSSLTRFTTRLAGRQVPVPLGFSVQPEGEQGVLYEFSAAILSGEQLLRLTGPVLVMPEDGSAKLGEIRLHPPLAVGFGQAWQCDGRQLMFGAVDEHLFLALDGRLHTVEQVPTAQGMRYESVDETAIGIDESDGEIRLVRGDEKLANCSRLEALEPPLSGGGNEPGWHITVDRQRIELTSDYGQTVTEAPLVQTGASGRTTRFRGVGRQGPILAAFARTVCRDAATGMPHPYTLAVQFEGGTLEGCGGRPRNLLVSSDWRVVRLGGEALPGTVGEGTEAEITIEFGADGRMGGKAACNRYTADYELGGEGLSIGPAAVTEMACPEPVMALEDRFLSLLAGIERFDIGNHGELVLIGRDGHIVAARDGPPGN